jgi:hypothetical protein
LFRAVDRFGAFDGIVHLAGRLLGTKRKVVHGAADNISGVTGVEDQLTVLPRRAAGSILTT